MAQRVLVTRPEPGASRTLKGLETLGFKPVVLPLTEIRALSDGLPQDFATGFDAVAVSSANALRHADRTLLSVLAGLPVFAVGARSAEAASAAGLETPTVGPGDAEGLAALMARRLDRGHRIAYLCGRVRKPGFEHALNAAGLETLPVETYDTVTVSYGDAELRALLDGPPFAAAMVYSSVAAMAFGALAGRAGIDPLIAQSTIICISSRVAAPLSGLATDRLRIAATPTEEAMLALLPR